MAEHLPERSWIVLVWFLPGLVGEVLRGATVCASGVASNVGWWRVLVRSSFAAVLLHKRPSSWSLLTAGVFTPQGRKRVILELITQSMLGNIGPKH